MDVQQRYIFISYSHENTKQVLPIIKALEESGITIWYDNGIEAGSEWPEYIAEHIDSCYKFLVCMSKAAQHSQNCRREINYALKQKKDIMTIYLEDVQLSKGMDMQLSSYQGIKKSLYLSDQAFLDRLLSEPFWADCRTKRNYYAFYNEKKGIGKVFDNWDDCSKEVKGVSGIKFQRFETYEEAANFAHYIEPYRDDKGSSFSSFNGQASSTIEKTAFENAIPIKSYLLRSMVAFVIVSGILLLYFFLGYKNIGLPSPIHEWSLFNEKGYYVCKGDYVYYYSGELFSYNRKLLAIAHDGKFSSISYTDIDGDNEGELINECQFTSLVHRDVLIFKRIQGVTYIGSVNPTRLVLPGLCYKNANSIDITFDDLSNSIVVKYKTSFDEDSWETKMFCNDISMFDFVEWDSETPLQEYAPDFAIYLNNAPRTQLSVYESGYSKVANYYPNACCNIQYNVDFKEIEGMEGHYSQWGLFEGEELINNWRMRVYYEDTNGISNPIAYSYGYEDDYVVDIDSDGIKELVCNCEGLDGIDKQVKIFKAINGVLLYGRFDIEKSKITYGTWIPENERYTTRYYPENNTFFIEFPDYPKHSGKSWVGRTVEIDKCIEYELYTISK